MSAKDTVLKMEDLVYNSSVEEAIEIQAEISFKEGKKEGIRLFAWWKDGIQYVGTCGTTLEKALKEIDDES